MKKILLFIAFSVALFAFGCKKDNVAGDNATADNVTKTDMTKYEKSLSIFQNPQYDFIYKLLEKGIEAKLEEDVTIPYPNHARHNSYNSGDNITILKGATPLGIAALFCTPSLVNDLIENGADLKATINNSQISAMIIQCGEAEQAGMLENYLSKTRKFEQNNPDIYKNKPALYAANAIIATDDKGNGQTILNYAVEHKLNNAIPLILKYAGWINYTNDKDPNNNKYPIITAIDSENYEALVTFLKATGNLHTKFKINDDTEIFILDYIFYNGLDEKIANNVPADVFLNAVLNRYGLKSAGISEIKELTKDANIFAKTASPLTLTTTKGNTIDIPVGSNIAHIAASLDYSYLIKGLAFLPNGRKLFDEQNENYDTPIHIAVRNGYFESVKTLLQAGSDVSYSSPNGTPLTVLANIESVKNQKEIAKLLLTTSALGNLGQLNEIGSIEMQAVPAMDTENKNVKPLIEKYGTETGTAYISKAKEIFSKMENGKILTRLLDGGIDNQLPFAVTINNKTINKGATPLIAAAVLCDNMAVNALLLGKAEAGIRITGENDLKFNAYDFADRSSKCDSSIIELLKNPNSAKADENYISEFANRKYNIYPNSRYFLEAEANYTQEPAQEQEPEIYSLENNNSSNDNLTEESVNPAIEDNADVDLIIEDVE